MFIPFLGYTQNTVRDSLYDANGVLYKIISQRGNNSLPDTLYFDLKGQVRGDISFRKQKTPKSYYGAFYIRGKKQIFLEEGKLTHSISIIVEKDGQVSNIRLEDGDIIVIASVSEAIYTISIRDFLPLDT